MEPQEAPPVGGMSRPPRPDAAAVGCGVDCFLDVTLWPCVARGGLLVSNDLGVSENSDHYPY